MVCFCCSVPKTLTYITLLHHFIDIESGTLFLKVYTYKCVRLYTFSIHFVTYRKTIFHLALARDCLDILPAARDCIKEHMSYTSDTDKQPVAKRKTYALPRDRARINSKSVGDTHRQVQRAQVLTYNL